MEPKAEEVALRPGDCSRKLELARRSPADETATKNSPFSVFATLVLLLSLIADR